MSRKVKVTQTETITPEQAKEMLAHRNAHNRPLRRRTVERYVAMMRAGKWRLTHQGIAFGPEGELLDGQHRLAACAESGVPMEIDVTRFVDKERAQEAREAIDTSPGRSASDQLVFTGEMTKEESKDLSAIITVIMTIIGTPVLSRGAAAVRAALPRFGAAARWALAKLPEHRRWAAPIRAAFALMWMAFPKEADEFADVVRGGVAEAKSAASTWIRSELSGKLRTSGGEAARKGVALLALRIMKAHVAEEGALAKLFVSDESLRFFMAKIERAERKAGKEVV